MTHEEETNLALSVAISALHKLRDEFAANAPSDEVRELHYNSLSRRAQETITGLKYPDRPANGFDTEALIAFQIDELEFNCAVNAAIRFKLADAMLRAKFKE